MEAGPDEAMLAEIENAAVELAQLGGTEIRAALGTMLRVKYKGAEEDPTRLKDPVSDVDARVETMVRERLAGLFGDHDIIGEEIDHRPGFGHDFPWAIDPIDGTANFINGFPLFASSVGVLYKGRPVVGAVWCSTSHALEPGVYHAAVGGAVRFNRVALATAAQSRHPSAARRRTAGVPAVAPGTAARPVRRRSNARSWRRACWRWPGSRGPISGTSPAASP